MSAAAITALREEFDRLAAEGRRIGFWWRDDDAVAPGAALDRLLGTLANCALPVSLAVVPSRAEPALAERLRGEDGVTVLVHGWRHANHAPPSDKKAEFGSRRPLAERAGEAGQGLAAIMGTFGPRALPVFVPPWNRIAPDLVPRLPVLGYRALSCFGEPRGSDGIDRIDTHLDPVDWRGTRSLASPEALTAMMRRALARGADTLGFLTHHLVFDEPLWSFCEEMAALAADHPAIRPAGLRDMPSRPVRQAEPARA